MRGGGQAFDHRRQVAGDQPPADDLVVDAPAVEVVLVEEVAERSVADVVEQSRQAQRLLGQGR